MKSCHCNFGYYPSFERIVVRYENKLEHFTKTCLVPTSIKTCISGYNKSMRNKDNADSRQRTKLDLTTQES